MFDIICNIILSGIY